MFHVKHNSILILNVSSSFMTALAVFNGICCINRISGLILKYGWQNIFIDWLFNNHGFNFPATELFPCINSNMTFFNVSTWCFLYLRTFSGFVFHFCLSGSSEFFTLIRPRSVQLYIVLVQAICAHSNTTV